MVELKCRLFFLFACISTLAMAQVSYTSNGGAVKLKEPYFIENLNAMYSEYVQDVKMSGYSIQLKSVNNKSEIEELVTEISENPDYIYMAPRLEFESPYFKLRLGYYLDKKIAFHDLMMLRRQYPEAILVSSSFTIQQCNER